MSSHIAFSNPGRDHPNQDYMAVYASGDAEMLVIADGIGGEAGGAVAAQSAVEAAGRIFQDNPETHLLPLFEAARSAVSALASSDKKLSSMGTTLTVCIVKGNSARFGHVGDTRLYHLRGDDLIKRTKDQTEMQHLLDAGVLTKSKAKTYHRRNILLSAISARSEFTLQQGSFDLLEGDRLILMSDGAYSLISKRRLRDLSRSYLDLSEAATALEDELKNGKVHDDFTAVLFQMSSE